MPIYESCYAALQVPVRDESPIYHHTTGVQIDMVSRLVAEFGVHGGEVTTTDPLTGQLEKRALIRGGFFDTEEAKERMGWSDEEHDSVVAKLDRLCRDEPYLIAKIEHVPVFAAPPWPTYDETHWKTIPTLADSLGFTAQALAYEKENKNREAVVAGLEEKLSQPLPESAPMPIGITLES
jgi:hypothetical protein